MTFHYHCHTNSIVILPNLNRKVENSQKIKTKIERAKKKGKFGYYPLIWKYYWNQNITILISNQHLYSQKYLGLHALLADVFFNVKNVIPLPRKTPANLATWQKTRAKQNSNVFFPSFSPLSTEPNKKKFPISYSPYQKPNFVKPNIIWMHCFLKL